MLNALLPELAKRVSGVPSSVSASVPIPVERASDGVRGRLGPASGSDLGDEVLVEAAVWNARRASSSSMNV